MTNFNRTLKNRKKQRIKINNIIDFNKALKKEGYKETNLEEEHFKEHITKNFKVESSVIDIMYKSLSEKETTYKTLEYEKYSKKINLNKLKLGTYIIKFNIKKDSNKASYSFKITVKE